MKRIRELFGHSPSIEAGEGDACYEETTESRRTSAPNARLCAITDVGRVRDHNEDTFHIAADGRLLIAADGMGGHEAGEVASALAVDALIEFFDSERLRAIDSGEASIEALLMESFEAADRKVREATQNGQGSRGMGTTLILACIQGDHLHTCHVGDVRCYVRNASGLHQVTQDHSVVGLLVRAGELTPEQARLHPQKNEILQAIGMPTALIPEVNTTTLVDGDLVLLCSDGLWEALSDEEIASIIDWEGSMRQRATQLVDRANEAGGNDNITVVLYEYIAQGGKND
ncbi:MAG: Stp1/IreP family PP2C-type Ser/Thr phosphatase [Blastocatellia bacterium]|nr:Stp1/IreP family PP2C-type Ser/Thr phosphatase [Blastocatellia bacterium]